MRRPTGVPQEEVFTREADCGSLSKITHVNVSRALNLAAQMLARPSTPR